MPFSSFIIKFGYFWKDPLFLNIPSDNFNFFWVKQFSHHNFLLGLQFWWVFLNCIFCFILFCFVLFCFVLFCSVLFCSVLFCFALSIRSVFGWFWGVFFLFFMIRWSIFQKIYFSDFEYFPNSRLMFLRGRVWPHPPRRILTFYFILSKYR